ncbi:MAG: hypothetical protein LUG99_18655 [Lachnospiraceae bacterium]|nr:hypothetical protein [Lachnospiraceae bacterium]
MTGCTVSIDTEGATAINVGDTSKAAISGGSITVYNASAIYRDKTATVDLGSDVAIDGVGEGMNTVDVGE